MIIKVRGTSRSIAIAKSVEIVPLEPLSFKNNERQEIGFSLLALIANVKIKEIFEPKSRIFRVSF